MAWGRRGLMRPGQLTYQYIHGFMDCFLALWRGWWWDRISTGRDGRRPADTRRKDRPRADLTGSRSHTRCPRPP